MKGKYLYFKKARKEFKKHKRMAIRLKSNPKNPYRSMYIESFIKKRDYPNYELYIHNEYFSIKNTDLAASETIRIPIDSKLWVEIYFCFDFISFIEEKE